MHAASEGLASAVRDKGKTVRTILPKGRKQSVRMLDAWDLVRPAELIAMPAGREGPMTRISRKERVSPLTKIAEQLPRKLTVLAPHQMTGHKER
jgi:hypothetical protein